MSISFNQNLAVWSGTSPSSSASYTPSSGDTSFVLAFTGAAGTRTLTVGSTTGSMTQQTINAGNNYNDGFGDTWSLWYQAAQTAVARTHSVSSSTGTDGVTGIGMDYSGAGNVGTATAVTHVNPGVGVGAVQGTSWTIPAGSIGIVTLANISSSTDTFTATTGSPTARVNASGVFGGKIQFYEYASQASFTPSFTCATGNVNDYVVLQFMIAPFSGNGFTASTGPYSYTGNPAGFYASLTPNLFLLASAAAYDYVGAFSSSDFTLPAAVGSYTIFGFAAQLVPVISPVTFSVSSGSYSIEAEDVTFSIGVVPPAPPLIPPGPTLPVVFKVTTRQFNILSMVEREWGAEWRAPDHRVYVFGGGRRSFDSTDMGTTGIYRPAMSEEE